MYKYIIKLIKTIINFYNKKLVNNIGNNSQLFCRIEKRGSDSQINIGNDCLINGRLVTEINTSKIDIKNNVFIGGKSILDCKDEILIEDDVLVSYECIIFDHDSHSTISKLRKDDLSRFRNNQMKWNEVRSKKIHIKKNAWICARSIILKGVTIGKCSIVAAGSIVTEDVPDFCLVSGNPAKVIKKVE